MRGSRVPAVLFVIGLLGAACSPQASLAPSSAPTSSPSQPDAGGSPAASAATCPEGPVTISLWDFNGETELAFVPDFEKANPCIKVEIKVTDYDAHHQSLLTGLASGSVPDVAGIEVSQLAKFLAQSQNFANLNELGATDIKDEYLPWMWDMAGTPDGTTQLGVPIAAAGLAIAYRRDLFEGAGLPNDRDAVAALWPTWDAFVATGRTYVEKAKKPFVESGGMVYTAAVNQGTKMYYEPDGTLIYATNPQVRGAWDIAAAVNAAGASAKLPAFSEAWTTGIAQGAFAAMVAPSWMQGVISGAAPNDTGKWDIAPLPGAYGNYGGSWLTIPAKAAHPKEAWEFIKWILSPEQQLVMFKATGALPATSGVYDSPDIQSVKAAYFNDAPIGQIYTKSLEGLNAIYQGPDQTAIDNEFLAGIARFEEQKETPDQAWASTLEKIALQVGP